MTSSYDVIKNVCELIKEKVGGDVYYIDLTRQEMDVKLVKVVALGGDFQAMNFPIISASKRMFEFGIRCGYSDKKTTYEELFLGSYQH
jgi:hypothetical protein